MKRVTMVLIMCLCFSILSGFNSNAKNAEENKDAPAVQETLADENAEAAGTDATAEEVSAEAEKEPEIWKIPSGGLDITLPESWTSSDCYLSYMTSVVDPRLIMTSAVVFAGTEDELNSAAQELGEDSEEFILYLQERISDLFIILSADNTLSKEDVKSLLVENETDISFGLEEIGDAEGWKFYAVTGESALRRPEPVEDKKEDIEEILDDLPLLFESIRFYEPVEEPGMKEGTAISFTTVDFDGNIIDSKELFAKNKYTMINLWMSWCHYCVGEMPELEEMNREFAEEGGAIIGVMLDGDVAENLDTGREAVKNAGVTFPQLVPTKGMKKQLITKAYPTTVIVDSNGIVVGSPIIGVNLVEYRERMEELLSGGSAAASTQAKSFVQTGITGAEASPGEPDGQVKEDQGEDSWHSVASR